MDLGIVLCPYRDKVDIKHYSVKFLDSNYEPPKKYWRLFYDKRELEKSDKLRGISDDTTKDLLWKLDRDAKMRCWNAIEEYIRRFTFDTFIELRDKEGLDAYTDWEIKVDYDNARIHIYKMKNNLYKIN